MEAACFKCQYILLSLFDLYSLFFLNAVGVTQESFNLSYLVFMILSKPDTNLLIVANY